MQTWQVEPSPGADVGGVSPVPVPMWRLSPAGVAAAAVPESVHSLPVQLAVQLHSNEPTAIDSTSPARPKSSRHPPLSKSVRDLVIEPAAGARCPIRDVLRGTTGMLRFGGYSTLPMRHVHA